MKIKILEFWDSKTVKDTPIRVYLASDGKNFYILTDRTGAQIEVGKTYEIENYDVRNQKSFIGNLYVEELYITKNTTIREAEDIEAPEIEKIDLEAYIEPFLHKPYIGVIKGKVSRIFSSSIILETPKGSVFVSMQKFHAKKLNVGDEVVLYGVRALLELPAMAKVEVISKAESSERCVEGILLEKAERTSRGGKKYHIYVIYDGEKIERAFSREEIEADHGDIVKICGPPMERGISLKRYEVIKKAESRRVSGDVQSLEEVSRYTPRYKAVLSTGEIIFTDEERKSIDKTMPSNVIGDSVVAIDVNAKRVTIIEVKEEEGKKILRIHDGEKEEVVEVDKSIEAEAGKDAIIIFNSKGNVLSLKLL